MRCQEEMNKIVAFLNDFTALVPPSTREAVTSHINQCVNRIAMELNVPEPVIVPELRDPVTGEPVVNGQ